MGRELRCTFSVQVVRFHRQSVASYAPRSRQAVPSLNLTNQDTNADAMLAACPDILTQAEQYRQNCLHAHDRTRRALLAAGALRSLRSPVVAPAPASIGFLGVTAVPCAALLARPRRSWICARACSRVMVGVMACVAGASDRPGVVKVMFGGRRALDPAEGVRCRASRRVARFGSVFSSRRGTLVVVVRVVVLEVIVV
jgi:hypothetical protein